MIWWSHYVISFTLAKCLTSEKYTPKTIKLPNLKTATTKTTTPSGTKGKIKKKLYCSAIFTSDEELEHLGESDHQISSFDVQSTVKIISNKLS